MQDVTDSSFRPPAGRLTVGRGREYPGEEDAQDRAAGTPGLCAGHERGVSLRALQRE